MKLLITIYYPFELWCAPPWLSERLRKEFPQLTVVQLPDYEGVEKEIADANIFVGWSLRPEQFRAARQLRWIHSTATGVHQLMSPELRASDVILTNARDVHGPVVAEHALAVIYAMAKRLPWAMRYQARRHWAQQDMWNEHPRPREVAGTVLLVVGLGGIGGELAKHAAAVGMHVIAVREHPEKGSGPAHEVFGLDELNTVLPRADFVVVAAPLTPRTERLINAERLSLMRPDAYLVNVSRGQLVDETALAAALRERRIAGAALDVFNQEPLPPDSPFWELENVLITPHTAAVTEKQWERHYALLAENLRRFLSGRTLLNIVDKLEGY
jgi:phosphoglycerate dehydrogenase-like enzyme